MNTQKNNSFMVQIDIITLQADKTIEKIIKSVYNEYNSSRYLISAIIKM